MVIIKGNGDRVKLYSEGGESYEVFVPRIGWVVNDEPSQAFEEYVARVLANDLHAHITGV